MPSMLLRYTALAFGALLACAPLASCVNSGGSCEGDASFSCKCVEVCSAQLDSCLQSGQHDRECSIEYEACVDGC